MGTLNAPQQNLRTRPPWLFGSAERQLGAKVAKGCQSRACAFPPCLVIQDEKVGTAPGGTDVEARTLSGLMRQRLLGDAARALDPKAQWTSETSSCQDLFGSREDPAKTEPEQPGQATSLD